MNARIVKVALAVAIVAAGGIGAAMGVKAYRYRFVGRDPEGRYHFETEPEIVYERTSQGEDGNTQGVTVARGGSVSIGVGDSEEANVEQMQSDLQEIDLLREQNLGELVGVMDIEINGHFLRVCRVRYVLADGRTMTMGESAPSPDKPSTPAQIESDHEEVARLREQGLRDVVKVIEDDIEGQTHRTLICRYVLADGREKTVGEGDPELPMPTKMLTSEQTFEVGRLQRLGEGEVLGTFEKQMYGKTFTFETHLFTLADGTVVTHAEGTPVGGKTALNQADWDELRALQEQNAGEALGTYEEEIDGTVFTFERNRYILGDGTEVIQAQGTPKID